MTFLRPTLSKLVIRALALGQLLKGQGIPLAKKFAHLCAMHTLTRKKMSNEVNNSNHEMEREPQLVVHIKRINTNIKK